MITHLHSADCPNTGYVWWYDERDGGEFRIGAAYPPTWTSTPSRSAWKVGYPHFVQ